MSLWHEFVEAMVWLVIFPILAMGSFVCAALFIDLLRMKWREK